ncbi:ensconsin isoform X2 [Anguilla anguilla]|uniref:ensconsin isoform X2 n=1 Tax=Anguilla anguilla TaxID=7936 RepID=UPI0015AF3190|nr:ensconsin isoform X2 [Anguilla anguilla]XP_035278071.1 ensconsin isoform X2 [Anguilla anguilla]
MPGLAGGVRQDRLKKGCSRAAAPGLFTITEEDEQQKSSSAPSRRRRGGGSSSSQPKSEEDRKPPCRPPSSGTGQNSNSSNAGSKPEPLVLKIDERQRLARERREEREKQIAAREAAWQEREERAKQYYERQLEERRRRLEEQRIREERRRTAVEEKRRQRLEEEKVRHEAVMRRTLERSQRAKPKPNRWSWGGPLHGSTAHTSGFVESSFLFPLDLAGLEQHFQGTFSSVRRYDAERRSVSTVNLSKHADPVITKRLSSSSATLLSSPDRALQKWSPSLKKAQSKPRVFKEKTPRHTSSASRRLPLTPWESSMVNRLLTPTHSYLARSKSAASLSGEAVIPVCPRSASCHPMSSTSFKSLQCRSADRPRTALSSLDSVHRRRTANPATGNKRDKDYVRKSWSNLSVAPNPEGRRSWCPGNQRNRTTLPSPVRATHKGAPRPPTPKQVRSPPTGEETPTPGRPLSPGNVRPVRAEPQSPQKEEEPEKEEEEEELQKEAEIRTPGKMNPNAESASPSKEPPSADPAPPSTPPSAPPSTPPSAPPSLATPPSGGRPSAGTTDPEEATRLLAEKRRQAREQREREEEEKRQREEAERRGREEMARRKAEERARREEEAQRLAEERRKREEEEKHAEEERLQREREEAERLQKQKEEEEARQKEEAERLRMEREKHFQKQEEERLERKKRLEEIMKRTRKSDPAEKKSVPHRNGEFSEPKTELTASTPQLTPPSVTVTSAEEDPDLEHGDRNGHRVHGHFAPALPTIAESSSATEAQPKENGVPAQSDVFEEVIELPVGTRLSRLEDDDLIPVVAFRENGSLRPLASLEEVQARQRAEPP